MSRRKWALIILLLLLGFGYFKLFYKSWTATRVPFSADAVLVLDVKRVTNTVLWQFLTTPSRWKTGDLFSKGTKDTSWRDMFQLPDYVFGFHVKTQPLHNWYAVLDIKSREGLEAGLRKFAFGKINNQEYLQKETGLYIFLHDEEALLARASAADSSRVREVARELFTEKKFLPRAGLQKAMDARSHLALYLAAGNSLQEPGIISVNFDKESLRIKGELTPAQQYLVAEEQFLYNSRSMASFGLVQPSPGLYASLGSETKERISKALGVDTDSFFLASHRSYSIDLQTIRERMDTAITYSYDDNFNQVENKVLQPLREPAFTFSANGPHADSVYRYLLRNQKLESSTNGMVFLPMPLVRSYCTEKNPGRLSITSFNYQPGPVDASARALLFFRLSVASIPPDLLRYLPDATTRFSRNVDEIRCTVNRRNNRFEVTAMLTKKKNALLLFDF